MSKHENWYTNIEDRIRKLEEAKYQHPSSPKEEYGSYLLKEIDRLREQLDDKQKQLNAERHNVQLLREKVNTRNSILGEITLLLEKS